MPLILFYAQTDPQTTPARLGHVANCFSYTTKPGYYNVLSYLFKKMRTKHTLKCGATDNKRASPAVVHDAAILADLAAGLLAGRKFVLFRAFGGSMRPFIQNGDLVTLALPDRRGPRPGDIVLYRKGDKAIALHRVISRKNALLEARGDSCGGRAETIRLEDVVGMVVSVRTPGGRERVLHPGRRFAGLVWAMARSAGSFVNKRASLQRS